MPQSESGSNSWESGAQQNKRVSSKGMPRKPDLQHIVTWRKEPPSNKLYHHPCDGSGGLSQLFSRLVKHFKYLGSLKSPDGDCSTDVNARMAMAKRRMCELTTLWKDRSIPVALKMRLVKTLVWTVLSYGAEAWTLKMQDERNITSMGMWLWRRMKRIWMEKELTIVFFKNLT